jgi:hypothetical protein
MIRGKCLTAAELEWEWMELWNGSCRFLCSRCLFLSEGSERRFQSQNHCLNKNHRYCLLRPSSDGHGRRDGGLTTSRGLFLRLSGIFVSLPTFSTQLAWVLPVVGVVIAILHHRNWYRVGRTLIGAAAWLLNSWISRRSTTSSDWVGPLVLLIILSRLARNGPPCPRFPVLRLINATIKIYGMC